MDPRTMREYHHFALVPDPLPERLVLAQETWTVTVQVPEPLVRRLGRSFGG